MDNSTKDSISLCINPLIIVTEQNMDAVDENKEESPENNDYINF